MFVSKKKLNKNSFIDKIKKKSLDFKIEKVEENGFYISKNISIKRSYYTSFINKYLLFKFFNKIYNNKNIKKKKKNSVVEDDTLINIVEKRKNDSIVEYGVIMQKKYFKENLDDWKLQKNSINNKIEYTIFENTIFEKVEILEKNNKYFKFFTFNK